MRDSDHFGKQLRTKPFMKTTFPLIHPLKISTETVDDVKNYKGTLNQEKAKEAFLNVVGKGCPVGDAKEYLFSQVMMVAFVAGRAFEA